MIIYLARNRINGKCYIGQTVRSFKERQHEHEYNASEGYKGKLYSFARALKKYGVENFEWEILEECADEADMNMSERFWISCYKTIVPNGYNLLFGGQKRSRHSDETKAKMSAWQVGRKMSEETKAKISAANKGTKQSPELRAKLSKLRLGTKRSDDTKLKMSKAGKGRKKSRQAAGRSFQARIDNGVTKLNYEKAAEIRAKSAAGALGKHLAVEYGVTPSLICCVLKGKIWTEDKRPDLTPP